LEAKATIVTAVAIAVTDVVGLGPMESNPASATVLSYGRWASYPGTPGDRRWIRRDP
jgi:hypothetical protein